MDFLTFMLWAFGGAIVVAICSLFLTGVAIAIRREWRKN